MIAEGTPTSSRRRIGGEQLEVTLAGPTPRPPSTRSRPLVAGAVQVIRRTGAVCRRRSSPRHGIVTAVIRALDDAGIAVDDIEIHHPSLDDVFFALTGRPDGTGRGRR